MKIGDKIKMLRKQKGLTQTELGEKLGVKTNAVSKWECGRVEDIPMSKVKAMSALFDVPPSFLIDDNQLPSNAIPIDLQSQHRIPILGRIAAGMPLYAEQNIEGYTLTDLNGGAEYFALRVSGDSMNAARIEDGDVIIVRRQDEVENGELAVVMVGDDDATVKRFYATNDTVTLMPQSRNPEHQPQIYDLKKTKIRVLGLVIKCEFMTR